MNDGAEKKQIEERLTMADFFFECLPDAAYWISMDGRLLNVNAAACAMLGYGREELLRLSILDFDPEYAVENIQADLDGLKRSGVRTFTRSHSTRHGSRIPVEITCNYVEAGEHEYVCAIVRDISERIRTEREASFYRTLIEYTRDPVYVLDPNDGCRMVYANQAACAHFGMNLEQLLTKRIPDWDPEFDMGNADAHFARLKQESSLRFESMHRVASGRLVPVEVTANYLLHDGRELVAGYFHDISERKRIDETLRESEQRYRDLVDMFPEAVYIHTGGKLVFANPQGAMLLGAASPEELYGREALDFVHPDYRDFVRARIANAFEHGTNNPLVEEVFVRLDGTPVPVEVTSTAYTYRGENALQIIVRDITERKMIQNELVKAQKLESLGVLAGGIAHDFNNILTGILGNLSFVRMQLDPSHTGAERLKQCEKAALQAAALARQLLSFSRGGEPVKRLCAVAPLITDAASFALRGSNVRSVVEMSADLWCLEADEGQISQVLHNLLLNAVQAMPDGGEVSIRACNQVVGKDNAQNLTPGDYVRIEVEDQGCGIRPEDLSRIFDPYFTTKQQGSGLGLASVYSIVKRHGGAVGIASTPGVGSCFEVFLPASRGRQPEVVEDSGCLRASGNGRVLIMDDEALIRDVATEILQFLGYQVACCTNGSEAVELYQQAQQGKAPFSAVILDLTIPNGMGGKEAAERILKIDPQAVLIVSSGYSHDPVSAHYGDYGFRGAIPKPFDVRRLASELARLLPHGTAPA